MNTPTCALCLKQVDEFDVYEECNGDIIVFVSKCHGQTEAHRVPRMALLYGDETEPKEAFLRARPIRDEDATMIHRQERTFFELVGRGLVACEDRGDYYRTVAPESAPRVLKFHSVKCERRRLARRGRRGRRWNGRGSMRVTTWQAMDSLMPPRPIITFVGHRFGRGAKIETWRTPKEFWPTVRRIATVYVAEGKTIPDATKAYLEAMLERAVIRAAR